MMERSGAIAAHAPAQTVVENPHDTFALLSSGNGICSEARKQRSGGNQRT